MVPTLPLALFDLSTIIHKQTASTVFKVDVPPQLAEGLPSKPQVAALKLVDPSLTRSLAAEAEALKATRAVAAQTWLEAHVPQLYTGIEHSEGSGLLQTFFRACPLQKLFRLFPQGLSVDVVRLVCWQVLHILRDLHETARRCHRDVKLTNVLVTEEGRVILVDFGSSCTCDDQDAEGDFGTEHVIAPEAFVVATYKRNTAATLDVYAVGILAYELACGRPAFGGFEHTAKAALEKKCPRESWLDFPPNFSPDVGAFARDFLRDDPTERFGITRSPVEDDPRLVVSWEKVFQHPFFSSLGSSVLNDNTYWESTFSPYAEEIDMQLLGL